MAPVVVRQTFVDTPRIFVGMDVNTTVGFIVRERQYLLLIKGLQAMRRRNADLMPLKASKSALSMSAAPSSDTVDLPRNSVSGIIRTIHYIPRVTPSMADAAT